MPLFGYKFTYTDGSFYTGTEAGAVTGAPIGSGGTFTQSVIDGSGNLVGTYNIFADGVTSRPTGSVQIDRLIENGPSFIPSTIGGAAFHGGTGIGSETGAISYQGYVFSLSNQVEPVLPPNIITIPTDPAPSAPDPNSAAVIEIYREVLARNPDPSGLAVYTSGLSNGWSVAMVRQDIAQSPEAQGDLNRLYHQILNRNIDPNGASTYTTMLAHGGSLNGVEQMLAQSPEAQGALNLIYQQVLGRNADPSGLTNYTSSLASGTSLDEVRGTVAHSSEAAADLARLFGGIIGRAPGIAELVGLEDRVATPGSSQQALATDLSTNGSAGGFALITPDAGNNALTALQGTPTLFNFGDIAFGNDTIAGFDPTRDTIQLSHTQAASFVDLQSKMTNVNGSTLITFDPTHSIQINAVAPTSLGANNFVIV